MFLSLSEDSFDTVLERGMAISYGVSGSLGIGSSLFARMVDEIQTASSSDGMPEFSVVSFPAFLDVETRQTISARSFLKVVHVLVVLTGRVRHSGNCSVEFFFEAADTFALLGQSRISNFTKIICLHCFILQASEFEHDFEVLNADQFVTTKSVEGKKRELLVRIPVEKGLRAQHYKCGGCGRPIGACKSQL